MFTREGLLPTNPLYERRQSVDSFRNVLIMTSPMPDMLPSSARIDKELRNLAVLSKHNQIIHNSLETTINICSGTQKLQYVHEINGISDVVMRLRDNLDQQKQQRSLLLSTLENALSYLSLQGQRDPKALGRAKVLLASFTGMVLKYNPHLHVSERRENGIESQATKEKSGGAYIGKLSEKKGIVDEAGVHASGARISTIEAEELPITVYRKSLGREGTTVKVEIPTGDEKKPLAYSISLLVKSGQKWQKVFLSPPIKEKEFDPKQHNSSQRNNFWTIDLPDKSQCAVVIEASPWFDDNKTREYISSIASTFAKEEDEEKVAQLLNQIIDGELSTAFFTDGKKNDKVMLSLLGSLKILKYLRENHRQDILDIPVKSIARKVVQYERSAVAYTLRFPFAGNPEPMPVHALLVGQEGHELISSCSKPGDTRDTGRKPNPDPSQIADRENILKALGINPDQPREVIIYDDVITHERDWGGGGGKFNNVNTIQTDREIILIPLATHEIDKESSKNLCTVVPFLTRYNINKIYDIENTDVTTFEQLLSGIVDPLADRPFIFLKSSLVRGLVEKELKEKALRRPQEGRLLGFGYTGITGVPGKTKKRGESHVRDVKIVGTLPTVEIALTTEMAAPPRTIKNHIRRELLNL